MKRRFLTCVFIIVPLVASACQGSRKVSSVSLSELQEEAVEAQNEGRYTEAEEYNRQTLKVMETLPGFPPSERARQMSNLASVLNLLGRPNEAMDLLLQSDQLLKEHPSVDPGQYITLDQNFGRSYALQANWNAAETRYSSAISKVKAANATETGYTIENELGLAYVYWKTGRLEQSARSYQLALTYFRKVAGPEHPVIRRIEAEAAQVQAELAQRK